MSGWWTLRSPRERWLLIVMIALFLVIFAWLGVWRPLEAARVEADARHASASAMLAETRARIAAVKVLAERTPDPLGMPLPEFLRNSAQQAGFSNAQVDPANGGRARVAIPSARTTALIGWIERLEGQGVFIEQASLRPNGDSTIAIEATVRARTG